MRGPRFQFFFLCLCLLIFLLLILVVVLAFFPWSVRLSWCQRIYLTFCLVPSLLLVARSMKMKGSSHLWRTLFLAFITFTADGAGSPPFVPVFIGGQDGYVCFRIPAMVTTTSGTILAVADGRISGCGDIPNPLDLILKRSTDNGATWGPLQVIADYGKNPNDTDIYPTSGLTNPLPRVAAGDAALLLDRTNGRVWIFYDSGASL